VNNIKSALAIIVSDNLSDVSQVNMVSIVKYPIAPTNVPNIEKFYEFNQVETNFVTWKYKISTAYL
jgi:hypothetical protein